MSKTKGSKNYFQGDKLYILKDVLDYIRKNEPSLTIPQSWEHGGGLNGLANKLGIVPDYDNGVKGRGHMTKYKGTTLYKFAPMLIEYLKNTTPKKPRLTPIEEPQNVPEPEPVEEPELTDEGLKVPKGFVLLTKPRYSDEILIRVADIIRVEEYFGENVKITTTAFSDIRVEETLEEVIEKLSKALEV